MESIKLNNEAVYLDYRENNCSNYLTFYLFDLYSKENSLIVECSCIYDSNKNTLIVNTITTLGEENRGYGSLVMQRVIDKAIELKASKITGFISPIDVHTSTKLKNQMYGFYKKHGATIEDDSFSININENQESPVG